MGCSYANSHWQKLVNGDGNLVIKGSHCKSITNRCCQSTICAPRQVDVILALEQVIELVWFTLSDKCLERSIGAIYVEDGWDYMAMTSRPPSCIQKGYRPDSHRRSLMNESYWES